MTELLLNARFALRKTTGVDRVAQELSYALNELRITQGKSTIQTIAPNRSSPILGNIWEQIGLACVPPTHTILSFCNSGPILRRNQVVMMHDAQVHETPESYSMAFRKWYGFMQPWLAKRATSVVTVSDFSRRQLEEHGVIPVGKAHIIHNGADHILRLKSDKSILTQHSLTPKSYILAFAGSARHKNTALLLKAAEQIGDASCPLVLIGRRPAACRQPNLRYLGRVTDPELRALYENATAFAFPSLTEGFGLPPLEAMNCGCPVIATTAGAVPEICGTAPIYCDPNDPIKWGLAMRMLKSNGSLATQLSLKGQQHAAAFTWHAAAQKLDRIIETNHVQAIGSNPVGVS